MAHYDFEHLNQDLTDKILSFNLPKKEYQYRLDRLNRAYHESMVNGLISTTYYNIAHEVKCIALMQTLGGIDLPLESKGELGPDMRYKTNYIECVCCSLGDKVKNGLVEFEGEGTFDYGVKRNKLLTRITSSIKSKLEYYGELVEKKFVFCEKHKYIVFLGLGETNIHFWKKEFGLNLNAVLFGQGDLVFSYDPHEGKLLSITAEQIDNIVNHNSSNVNVNIFTSIEYKPVSAVIYTNAGLYDDYTIYNTFIFANPNANRSIKYVDFTNMYYWSMDKSGGYTVKKNYKQINIGLKRIY